MMKSPIRILRTSMVVGGAFLLLGPGAVFSAARQQKPEQQPPAGIRATPLEITWLYVQPSTTSQKMSQIQIGREMAVMEKSGSWLNVEANIDTEHIGSDMDRPVIGSETAPPLSGWMEAKGIVATNTPDGDQILMGAAANEEALASHPSGPANAANAALLLYTRLYQMFPNSPLAPQARWRAADIQWQIQKADVSTLPSSKAQQPYLHEQLDGTALRKVIKMYPGTRWAALAAFDLIDNQLCGQWEGSVKCPERESGIYEKYAERYPNGPRTARALFEAAYREAVLTNMYTIKGDKSKADKAREQCRALAKALEKQFPHDDYTWRAGMRVFKLDQGIPVIGFEEG